MTTNGPSIYNSIRRYSRVDLSKGDVFEKINLTELPESTQTLLRAMHKKIQQQHEDTARACRKAETVRQEEMKSAIYIEAAIVTAIFTAATVISFKAFTGAAGVLNDLGQCLATYLDSTALSTLVSLGTGLLGFSSGLVNGAFYTESTMTVLGVYGPSSGRSCVTRGDYFKHMGKILAAIAAGTGANAPSFVPFWDGNFSKGTALSVTILLVIGGMTALSTVMKVWNAGCERFSPPPELTVQQKKIEEIIKKLTIFVENPAFVRQMIPTHDNLDLNENLSRGPIDTAVNQWLERLGNALDPQADQNGYGAVNNGAQPNLNNGYGAALFKLAHVKLTAEQRTSLRRNAMLSLTSVFQAIFAYGLITGWEYGPLTMIAVICSLLFAAVIVHFVLKEYSFKKPSLQNRGYNTVYETAADRIAAGLFWFFACFSWASVGKLFVTGVAPIYPTPPTCAPLPPGELLPNMNWGALMGFTLSAVSLGVTNGMVGEPVAKNYTTKLVRNLTTALFTGADENVSTPTQAARRAVRRFFQGDRFMNTWGEQIFNEWRIQKICKDLQGIAQLYSRYLAEARRGAATLGDQRGTEVYNRIEEQITAIFETHLADLLDSNQDGHALNQVQVNE